MGVDERHPAYEDGLADWETMRDSWQGDRAVKAKNEDYLPKPTGFKAMSDQGVGMYSAYIKRAQFPNIVAPTVRGMAGVIHRTETQIEMPEAMQGLWERATKDGLSLEAFHRRITRELLLTGRYGVLVDAPSQAGSVGEDFPFLAGYDAEDIINWSKDGTLFVLDETDKQRKGFTWFDRARYRVLELIDGAYLATVYDGDNPEPMVVTPQKRGGGGLEAIPFVIIGATDLTADVDEVPLLGVARHALAIYRLDADYRYQLYMTGQETLFIVGGSEDNKPTAVGAGVVHVLPEGCDAKYVGPSGVGIDAHRQAIVDEREAAILAGARLFDSGKGAAESGDALRIRFAAQTATLTSIAQASAQGLERALKSIAIMIGANPDEVVVTPNLSFIDATLSPQDAAGLVSVWQAGAISKQTLYEALQKGEVASSERTFEEEQALLEDELPAVDPDGPDDPPAPDELLAARRR